MIEVKACKCNENSLKSLCEIESKTREGVRQSWYFTGKDLKDDAQKFITEGPKTGRIYRVKVRGRTILHQASAPGESPANLTGALRASIDYNVSDSGQLEFGAGNEDVDYASRLEEEMNRPFLIRSINENEGNIYQHFEREIMKEFEK